MDLRRAFAALLIACAAIGAGSALPLREAKWIAPEARLDALTSSPPVCIGTLVKREQLMIAEAAFQTPLLLGGQAARTGLSCASCHPSGRANSAFQFPGLSGDPGTADVTSSIMSHRRGDSVFNPVQIPDLAVDRPKVERDATSPALRSFVRGLIVEEFDGPEPPPAVLDALVNYVRAMGPERCTSSKRIPISLGRHLADSAAALEMARSAISSGDEATAWLMMAAARHSLGLIHERYVSPTLGTQRTIIIAADRKIQALQAELSLKTAVDTTSQRKIFEGLRVALEPSETKSLYNPKVLAQALGG